MDNKARRKHRTKALSRLLAAILLLGLAIVLSRLPLSYPDGAYYDPIGGAYWVFEGGRCSLHRGDGSDQQVLTYWKQNDQWVFRGIGGRVVGGRVGQLTFTTTILGMKVHDLSGADPDRFLFRRCFAWPLHPF
jgi:hypothetical protein